MSERMSVFCVNNKKKILSHYLHLSSLQYMKEKYVHVYKTSIRIPKPYKVPHKASLFQHLSPFLVKYVLLR